MGGFWLDTSYRTQKTVDPGTGKVLYVDHVPEAIRLHFLTTAPAAPSFGPTEVFLLYYKVVGTNCTIILEMWISGPQSDPMDRPQGAHLYQYSGCPNGGQLISGTLSFSENESIIEFPLSKTRGLIEVGTELSPASKAIVWAYLAGGGVHTKEVDWTARPTGSLVVGSDVPPDVDCVDSPDHAECQSP